jgi:hypothetical protein
MNKKMVALIACAVAALGSFMPWVSAQTIFGDMNVAGTKGDGVITLILAVLTAIFVYQGSKTYLSVALGACAFGVFVSVYNLFNINDKVSGAPDSVVASIGYGLYLCVIGFVVATAITFQMRRAKVLVTSES